MATVIDLGNLGTLGADFIGRGESDQTGLSVSGAGDVNGDGIDDVVIGYLHGAYVIFGREGGIENLDLENLEPSDGFRVLTDELENIVPGPSVASAGDINGDGFDDLIVGGYHYFTYESIPNAFVIFGKAEFEPTIDVSTFRNGGTTQGFRIVGELDTTYSGARVSSAGDFNGDGFDDMLIGTPSRDNLTGGAYVIFGKASAFDSIELADLDPNSGFAILGAASGDEFGHSVSGAGDVNGDGYDDIIIGAPYGSASGARSGDAYVIFGKSTGFGTIDLSNLDSTAGFLIHGPAMGAGTGWSVSSAGDVNDDGFDDVIVGAPGAKGSVTRGIDGNAGEAFIVFGKADGFRTVDLAKLKPIEGFKIEGADAGDLAGWSVDGAGDLNNDGFDDILVGAPSADGAALDAGEAYIIFGKAGGFRSIDLGKSAQGRSPDDFIILRGEVANDRAGWSVAGANDIDGDGVDDVIVGAPWNDLGSFGEPDGGAPTEPEDMNPGRVYVLYGAQLPDLGRSIGEHGRGDDHSASVDDLIW